MNEQIAEGVQNYLVQHIKNAKTKQEVENIEYGPASEYLLAAYRIVHTS